MISMAGFEDPEKRKEQERLAAAAQAQAQAQAQAPAPAEPGLLQMPEKPMTPFEQLRDNHGTGGAILRLLGTGLSGGLLGDVLTPEIGAAAQAKYDTDMATYDAYQKKMLEQQFADQAAQAERDRFATIDSEYIKALKTPDPSDDGQATANFLRNGGSRESANAIRQSMGMNPLNANDMTFKDFNTNYRKDTQAFADFQDQYTTLQDSLASDSGVGDLGLVFGLAKLFDPRSVVREGEVTTLQSTAGLPAQVMNMYKEVKEGRKLAPEQREQIQDYADRAYLNRLSKYDQVRERYIGRGTEGFGFANLSTRLDDRALYRDRVDSIQERLSKAGVPKKQAEDLAEQMVDEAMQQFITSQNPSDPTFIFPEAGNR